MGLAAAQHTVSTGPKGFYAVAGEGACNMEPLAVGRKGSKRKLIYMEIAKINSENLSFLFILFFLPLNLPLLIFLFGVKITHSFIHSFVHSTYLLNTYHVPGSARNAG